MYIVERGLTARDGNIVPEEEQLSKAKKARLEG